MASRRRLKIRWRTLPVAFVVIILLTCGQCVCDEDGLDPCRAGGGCGGSYIMPECGPPVLEIAGNYEGAFAGVPVVLSTVVHFSPDNLPCCDAAKYLIAYEWEQFSGPHVVELEGTDYHEARFIPPSAGEYGLRCRAVYPIGPGGKVATSEWAYVYVNAEEKEPVQMCDPPSANAGEDRVLALQPGMPVTVSLDGSGSQTDLGWGCEELTIESYRWTVVAQPAGSDVVIQRATQTEANVEIQIPGTYIFQLSVRDSTDRADLDTLLVALVERRPCDANLAVKVIEAQGGEAIPGAQVTVIDFDEATHQSETDARGEASFDGLASGRRRSITVQSSQVVPPLPGVGGNDRPKYEITTVMDHCSDEIIIPVRLTESGKAAIPMATVSAKVPLSLFDALPRWHEDFGPCDSDQDCRDYGVNYPCSETTSGDKRCLSRSLVNFFSLNDPLVSGQFRAALLLPVLPLHGIETMSTDLLFHPPVSESSIWPGNLVTDDSFLNGLGPSIGIDPWGEPCEVPEDCPNLVDYECDQDPVGDMRCKDLNTLRNIKMEVPAGVGRHMVLLMGVVDSEFYEFISIVVPCFVSDYYQDDCGSFLGLETFRLKTLEVCPFTVDVVAGQDNDISDIISEIDPEDCWSVNYKQQDVVVPMLERSPAIEPATCESDADCCNDTGDCGWPLSGRKCLANPEDSSGQRYCLMPLFRVQILSDDYVFPVPDLHEYDPAAKRSDGRLCSSTPGYAPFEMMCDYGGSVYEICDPRDIRDLGVPADFECSFGYSLAVASLDFPEGSAELPEGGRVVLGYDFNRALFADFSMPSFLIPPFKNAVLNVSQCYLRNTDYSDQGYEMLPGKACAANKSNSRVASPALQPFLPLPASGSLVDAGIDTRVVFIAADPTQWPPLLLRTYSKAKELNEPEHHLHNLPEEITGPSVPGSEVLGIVLSLVDRDYRNVYKDPLWRIYASAEMDRVEIPAELSPFESGDEVWVTLQALDFSAPFDYDLFPFKKLTTEHTRFSEDSYPLIVP